jgi:peptidoglycan/LPS O-acetylase OafA/YrhL
MRNRGQLALGIILILLGAWFIAQRQVPALGDWVKLYMNWPLNVVAAGAIILLIGILVGAPGLAIPAAIVAGIGGILYYQNSTSDYTSWSYMWALIPGFVGVGQLVASFLGRSMREARSGLNLIAISAVMFVIFAALFGRLSMFGPYFPAIALILVGVWFLVRGFWRKNKQ